MAVLLDSGFLFAALCAKDDFHAAVIPILQTIHEPIVLPVPAITEVAYLLGREMAPKDLADFAAELATTDLALENPTSADYSRAAILILQYADARLDFIDALIVAIAERMNIKCILTIDQRDFRMIRPTHCDGFQLLP
jgi:predicted nucleic acid-binding protein